MINNQLLDYIKQQKLNGVSNDDIKSRLQIEGWQPQVLDEAFRLTENDPNQTLAIPAPESTPNPQPTKLKAPIFVIIIAWLMLIGGIFSLLGFLPFVLLGGFGKVGILFFIGILNLVRGVGLIIVSFGIRSLKRWSLNIFSIITILALIVSTYNFTTSPKQELIEFADVGIQILVMLYFWSIQKKFV